MQIEELREEVEKLLSLYQGTPTDLEVDEITKYLFLFNEYAVEIIEKIKYNREVVFYPKYPDFVRELKNLSSFCPGIGEVWKQVLMAVKGSQKGLADLKNKDPLLYSLVSDNIGFSRLASSSSKDLGYMYSEFTTTYTKYTDKIYEREIEDRIREIRNRNTS